MLKRIKYASRFAHPLTDKEIEAIASESEANNRTTDVTGVLMASGNLFFQVLEGPREAVDEIFERICRDRRHSHVVLLAAEHPVTERLFPNWAMKALSLGESRASRLEPLASTLEAIVELGATEERLKGSLERALWQELIFGTQRVQETE